MADPDQKLGRESMSVQCRCHLHVRIARKEKKTIARHVRRLCIDRNRLFLACLEVVDDNGHSGTAWLSREGNAVEHG
jgi:hypothetical protein